MQQQALELVKKAVTDLAEDCGFPELLNATESTPLFGGELGIDSLSLVRLVADIERDAERRFGVAVILADERAMSRRNSPFRTVGTLAELLAERIGEARG